ncbi:hypothetical protein F2Q68_00025934 [Brassica cretica]|uniref:Uncharacterized protein n=1 Tax=Brassica cretica TaxID=69181 RepID=A0A8S9IFH7_BRACR|nr:hypothetical protein F2Q68_00025934 [Brassica cretica]
MRDVKLFKMESGMEMKVVVTFKGSNYLVWSRMVKTAVGSKSLWKHITSGEAPMAITQEVENREGDGKALVTCTGAINPRGNNQDFIRRSEMDALIKRLKDNGNIHGYSFGASMIARTIEMTPNVAEIARIDRQDLGLLLVLEGAMTNSTYVSRFSFILIPYRFKVRDSAIILVSDVRESSLRDG